MALYLNKSLTQYLSTQQLPVTTFPLTVGFWAFCDVNDTANKIAVSFSNSTVTNQVLDIGFNGSEIPYIGATTSAGVVRAPTTTVPPLGDWVYFLARYVSGTQRRLAVLHSSGVYEVAFATANRAPSWNWLVIGTARTSSGYSSNLLLPGGIAELFVTQGDVYSDSVDAERGFIQHLAYNGPFALPEIASKIRFYASFRNSINRAFIGEREGVNGLKSISLDVSASAPTLIAHPPLPGSYERPGRVKTNLFI